MSALDDAAIAAIAARLHAAARSQASVEPLTTTLTGLDVADAYRIQDAVVALRTAEGETVVGSKLGLTSRAKQVEMGVRDVIGAWLTDAMELRPGEPLVTASLGQPRAEPEIAFRMARDLAGEGTTAADVLAATDSVMTAIEILDSRYRAYAFTLPDVIADNASAAGFILGDPVSPAGLPLDLVGVVFEVDGAVVATASGAASLGHPAEAVAWWVRLLAAGGRGLRAGDIVLSGALTGAFPLLPGTVARATIDRLGVVEVRGA